MLGQILSLNSLQFFRFSILIAEIIRSECRFYLYFYDMQGVSDCGIQRFTFYVGHLGDFKSIMVQRSIDPYFAIQGVLSSCLHFLTFFDISFKLLRIKSLSCRDRKKLVFVDYFSYFLISFFSLRIQCS